MCVNGTYLLGEWYTFFEVDLGGVLYFFGVDFVHSIRIILCANIGVIFLFFIFYRKMAGFIFYHDRSQI